MNIKDYIKDNDPNKFWRLSSGQHENLLNEALERIEAIEYALKIIAGKKQGANNLMSNVDIAIEALGALADFKIGQKVLYKNEIHIITDIDEGYDYLALGGDKYITPNHKDNRCISAPMSECVTT